MLALYHSMKQKFLRGYIVKSQNDFCNYLVTTVIQIILTP